MPRKTENTLDPIKNTQISDVYVSICLDTRTPMEKYPLAIRFYDGHKTFYYKTGDRLSREDYKLVQKSTGKGRISDELCCKERPFDIRMRVIKVFDTFVDRLTDIAQDGPISITTVKTVIMGKSESTSFYSMWESIALSKKKNTKDSYLYALSSFKKAVGEIYGFKIPSDAIVRWNAAMVQEGKSKTTIGIYMRACRVAWKACQKEGYIPKSFYPFGKDDSKKVAIPKGAKRKHEYLTASKMNELYQLFCSQEYPDDYKWGPYYREKVHRSLGLFLAQYLCNGFNLADGARLTYNDYYFISGGKAFQFIRHKTDDRMEEEMEVVIPIIPELQVILDQIAAKPELGARVFPYILGDAQTEDEEVKRIGQENANIRARMAKLFEAKGWPERPSGTWCRHSFATNLTHAGVPHDYISESMAHSQSSKDVTSLYIARYPLSQQMKYNALLLSTPSSTESIADAISQLSEEEKQKLLAMLKMQSSGPNR